MPEDKPTHHENIFGGEVRLVREEDKTALRPILETWVRDGKTKQVIPEEIEGILDNLSESIRGTKKITYFVAETPEGNVVGMMGFRPPEEKMLTYTSTPRPAELVNAFVSNDYRGKGVGHVLVNMVKRSAKEKGYTEIILNSGPRYRFSGWPTWLRLFGKPSAIARGYYGEGADAPVWREELK